MSPPPHVEGKARENQVAKREAFNAAAVTTPLLLLCIPVVLGNIIFSFVNSLLLRLYALFVTQSPASSKSIASSSRSNEALRNVAPETQSYCPVKLTSTFIGDIAGYMNFALNNSLFYSQEKYGPVFAANIGMAVVTCLDVTSAEALFNKDVMTCKGMLPMNQHLEPKFSLNFYNTGLKARQIRDLHLCLVPQTVEDRKVTLALENMRSVLTDWASLDPEKLRHFTVVDAAHQLLITFSSSIYFGTPLDADLMKDCYPIPTILPLYPGIPKLLFPLYYRYSAALSALKEQVSVCPYSHAIKDAAIRSGFQASSHCAQHLLTAAGVNALELSNPIINLFLILPLFPDCGQELLQDDKLLDSFVWELYRHNGPVMCQKTSSDTDITDSSGTKYSVKPNTRLYTDLSMALRDPVHWKDPHVFKVERFYAGVEPLPLAAWGCPMNQADNEKLFYSTHQCVFRKIAHPFLKQFVTHLLWHYSFQMDCETTDFMQERVLEVSPKGTPASEFRLHVDYCYKYLHKGLDGAINFTPSISTKAHFSKVQARKSVW